VLPVANPFGAGTYSKLNHGIHAGLIDTGGRLEFAFGVAIPSEGQVGDSQFRMCGVKVRRNRESFFKELQGVVASVFSDSIGCLLVQLNRKLRITSKKRGPIHGLACVVWFRRLLVSGFELYGNPRRGPGVHHHELRCIAESRGTDT